MSNGHQKDNVLVFGVEKSSFLVPSLIEGHKATKDNEVLADETLKIKDLKLATHYHYLNQMKIAYRRFY